MYKINLPLVAVFAVLLLNCSSTAQTAQQALNATAKVIVAVDAAYAPQYEQARIMARATSDTWEERDAKLRNWDKAAYAITSSYHWLAAAQATIDTMGSCSGTEKCDFGNVGACLIQTLREVRSGLQAVGVKLPDKFESTLDLLVSVLPEGNSCKE